MEKRRTQGYGPEVTANLCGIELTQAAEVSKYYLFCALTFIH